MKKVFGVCESSDFLEMFFEVDIMTVVDSRLENGC